MKTYKLSHFCGKNYELAPIKRKYANNGALAVDLLDVKTGEIFATATVNLPDFMPTTIDEILSYAYVDTNNNPWLILFLLDNHLALPTGRVGRSGFCEYPQYMFNLYNLNDESVLKKRILC